MSALISFVFWVVLSKHQLFFFVDACLEGFGQKIVGGKARCLAAEPVEGAALALEGVHHVHGGHGLPAGVLGVCDRVADDVLQEHLEDAAGLLVDESRDTLHTCLLYTSPSPRDLSTSRMPSSA